MPDSDKSRNRANRLFELALKAHESGFTAASWGTLDFAIVAVVLAGTVYTGYLIYGLLFL
jgi:hypothetical protein